MTQEERDRLDGLKAIKQAFQRLHSMISEFQEKPPDASTSLEIGLVVMDSVRRIHRDGGEGFQSLAKRNRSGRA